MNGQDIRRLDPSDYHKRVTAVFQGFSKFDASIRENVGVGYYPEMRSFKTIGRALSLAGADHIVSSLPHGLKTRLDPSGPTPLQHVPPAYTSSGCAGRVRPHGLSGGEVRRSHSVGHTHISVHALLFSHSGSVSPSRGPSCAHSAPRSSYSCSTSP